MSDFGGRSFDKGREILGSDDKPLVRVPDQKQPVESFGSWLDLVDWDDDGDLDVVGGGFGGELFVFVNEGTRMTPSYLPIPARLKLSDGSPARVPGDHGAVVVSDWDGDGLFDLVCGSASGAVVWFRNVGRRGRPQLLPPETLVPASEGSGYSVWLEPGAAPRPGIRAQLDVVDWNGDGKPDLLVGDFSTNISPRSDLTAEQKRAAASLRLQHDSAAAEVLRLRKGIDAAIAAYMATMKPAEIATKAGQERIRAKQSELEKQPDFAVAAKREGEIWEQLTKFLEKPQRNVDRNDWAEPHGFVWLHLRK